MRNRYWADEEIEILREYKDLDDEERAIKLVKAFTGV